MSKGLTAKQFIFCEAYLETLNGVEAARRAYKAKNYATLGVIAAENLKKPRLREYIDERLHQAAMGADEVLYRLTQQAKGVDVVELVNIDNIVETDEDGNKILRPVMIVDLEKIKAAGLGKMIKKIKQNVQGAIEVEWIDSQHALELLGKYHALFVEQVKHSGVVVMATVSADDLAKARQKAKDFEKDLLGDHAAG